MIKRCLIDGSNSVICGIKWSDSQSKVSILSVYPFLLMAIFISGS